MNSQKQLSENRNYSLTVSRIEGILGIELSILEKARIRELIRGAINRNETIEGGWTKLSVQHEAMGVFLAENYGFPYVEEDVRGRSLGEDWSKWVLNQRKRFVQEHDYDGISQYFREKQEELHKP